VPSRSSATKRQKTVAGDPVVKTIGGPNPDRDPCLEPLPGDPGTGKDMDENIEPRKLFPESTGILRGISDPPRTIGTEGKDRKEIFLDEKSNLNLPFQVMV
jgi:hypothetical protein